VNRLADEAGCRSSAQFSGEGPRLVLDYGLGSDQVGALMPCCNGGGSYRLPPASAWGASSPDLKGSVVGSSTLLLSLTDRNLTEPLMSIN
jgi:hypothetical protein